MGIKNKIDQYLVLVLLMVSLGFTFFVGPLVAMHTYLACTNLTTWEFFSWMKITYMRVWPRKLGSPFSNGWKQNLRMFCCYNFRKEEKCHQWKMPKKLPKLS